MSRPAWLEYDVGEVARASPLPTSAQVRAWQDQVTAVPVALPWALLPIAAAVAGLTLMLLYPGTWLALLPLVMAIAIMALLRRSLRRVAAWHRRGLILQDLIDLRRPAAALPLLWSVVRDSAGPLAGRQAYGTLAVSVLRRLGAPEEAAELADLLEEAGAPSHLPPAKLAAWRYECCRLQLASDRISDAVRTASRLNGRPEPAALVARMMLATRTGRGREALEMAVDLAGFPADDTLADGWLLVAAQALELGATSAAGDAAWRAAMLRPVAASLPLHLSHVGDGIQPPADPVQAAAARVAAALDTGQVEATLTPEQASAALAEPPQPPSAAVEPAASPLDLQRRRQQRQTGRRRRRWTTAGLIALAVYAVVSGSALVLGLASLVLLASLLSRSLRNQATYRAVLEMERHLAASGDPSEPNDPDRAGRNVHRPNPQQLHAMGVRLEHLGARPDSSTTLQTLIDVAWLRLLRASGAAYAATAAEAGRLALEDVAPHGLDAGVAAPLDATPATPRSEPAAPGHPQLTLRLLTLEAAASAGNSGLTHRLLMSLRGQPLPLRLRAEVLHSEVAYLAARGLVSLIDHLQPTLDAALPLMQPRSAASVAERQAWAAWCLGGPRVRQAELSRKSRLLRGGLAWDSGSPELHDDRSAEPAE